MEKEPKIDIGNETKKRSRVPCNVITESLSSVDAASLKEIAKEFATLAEEEFTGLGTAIPTKLKEVEILIENGNLSEAREKIGWLATLGHSTDPGWAHSRYLRDKGIVEKYGAKWNYDSSEE